MAKIANYLLRILATNTFLDVLVVSDNDDDALAQSMGFINYEGDIMFELYDVRNEVARRVV